MTDADMAMKMDPIYKEICLKFKNDQELKALFQFNPNLKDKIGFCL